MYESTACVILAGGKSSRMGEDKALLPFGNCKSLSQYQYKRLSSIFKHCYISAKSNKFDFECNIIYDTHKEHSPLQAICSIFDTIKQDTLFLISVDMPFFSLDSIDTLIKEHSKDATLYSINNNIEPLGAIYSRSVQKFAKYMVEQKEFKLKKFIEQLDTKVICSTKFKDFINLNYKSDYLKYYIK